MDEEWNESVLRIFLDKMSKDELVKTLIGAIKAVCGDDKEALKRITKEIVTEVQVREIMAGKGKLEHYQEPHRTELANEVGKRKCKYYMECSKEVAEKRFKGCKNIGIRNCPIYSEEGRL